MVPKVVQERTVILAKGSFASPPGIQGKTWPKQMLELFREIIKGIIYFIIAFPFLVVFITILLLVIL